MRVKPTLGSQSVDTNKFEFINRSRNAPAMKLPFLALLLTHFASFGRGQTIVCILAASPSYAEEGNEREAVNR
jgi:hypothetical protein